MKTVREKQLPILFSFTRNDRLVEWELPFELVQQCGVKESSIVWLDSDEQPSVSPLSDQCVTSIDGERFNGTMRSLILCIDVAGYIS